MSQDPQGNGGQPWAHLEAVPSDGILVHIGTHKTGTTALQADLEALAPQLAQHDVSYPHTQESTREAAQALTGNQHGWAASGESLFADVDARPTQQQRRKIWRRYVRQIESQPGRVLISCETFCQANDAQAARLVRDLGPDRVHVIVAFRPLQALLPSTWQEYLRGGRTTPYEEWLAGVLADPPDPQMTPSFWRRNDIPTLVNRWTDLLGAAKVTVAVIDARADMKVRRAMEGLLALPEGAIAETSEVGASNRSLTRAECEFLLAVNAAARDSLAMRDYLELIRFGAVPAMVDGRIPPPSETGLGLPEWAVPRVQELGRAHAAWLRNSDVAVLGDVDVLAEAVSRPASASQQLPSQAAELALLGAVNAAARRSQAAEQAAQQTLERAVRQASTDPPAATTTQPTGSSRLTQGLRRRASKLRRQDARPPTSTKN